MNLNLNLSSLKLYNGRRSFSCHLTINRRRFGVYRWDTERAPLRAHSLPGHCASGMFTLRRGPQMTWYLTAATLEP